MAQSDPVIAASDIFRRYLEDYRELVTVMMRCWTKGWPDRKRAIESAREAQSLHLDQALMRLDCLQRNNLLRSASCGSLADLHDCIFEKWSDNDEAALLASNPQYKGRIATQAAAISLEGTYEDTAGPSQMAKRDPEHIKAFADFDAKCRAHNEQLKALTSP